MKAIKKYLDEKDISGYKIAKVSGVTQSTIADAVNKDVGSLSVRVVRAIAQTVNKPSWQVLHDLEIIEKEDSKMKNEIISKINDIQARNDEFNQIESIGSMKDINKLKSETAKDMDGEEYGFDVDELNSFNGSSTNIIIIATDEFENGKAVYKAIDMSQDGSARVAREFFNSNTYSELDNLESLLKD